MFALPLSTQQLGSITGQIWQELTALTLHCCLFLSGPITSSPLCTRWHTLPTHWLIAFKVKAQASCNATTTVPFVVVRYLVWHCQIILTCMVLLQAWLCYMHGSATLNPHLHSVLHLNFALVLCIMSCASPEMSCE